MSKTFAIAYTCVYICVYVRLILFLTNASDGYTTYAEHLLMCALQHGRNIFINNTSVNIVWYEKFVCETKMETS